MTATTEGRRMSDLPDIDTSNVSLMCYWNAIDDGGAPAIEPQDVLNDGNISEYVLFDNGIQIDQYDGANGRTFKARVKNDGWFVAWLDRGDTFVKGTDDKPDGWYDVIEGWHTAGSVSDRLYPEIMIENLQSQLSVATTFNRSDIGIHHYEYPDADNLTLLSSSGVGSGGQPSFVYTSGTTVNAAVVTGFAKKGGYSNIVASVLFDGEPIASDNTDGDIGRYGAADLVADNRIPDADTEYVVNYSATYNSGTSAKATAAVILLWS